LFGLLFLGHCLGFSSAQLLGQGCTSSSYSLPSPFGGLIVTVQHANSLLDWAKRWDLRLQRAPTFKVCIAPVCLHCVFPRPMLTAQEGSLDAAWRALLTEAESSAAIMKELEKVLRNEVPLAPCYPCCLVSYPFGLLGRLPRVIQAVWCLTPLACLAACLAEHICSRIRCVALC
jgi:hypothetical protein